MKSSRVDLLICYDISNPKRLRRCARLLENSALRIQKSIFLLLDEEKEGLSRIVAQINRIIDPKEDDVSIYTVRRDRSIHLNSGVDLDNPLIIKHFKKDDDECL